MGLFRILYEWLVRCFFAFKVEKNKKSKDIQTYKEILALTEGENLDQIQKIEERANRILEARNLYPESSYADLYNQLTIPRGIRKVHQKNDKAVMEAYGFDWINMTESECVAELVKLYHKAVSDKK